MPYIATESNAQMGQKGRGVGGQRQRVDPRGGGLRRRLGARCEAFKRAAYAFGVEG